MSDRATERVTRDGVITDVLFLTQVQYRHNLMAQSSTTTGDTRGPREASLRILYIVGTDTPVASAQSLANQ